MTICIAAIASRDRIVCATDQMLTLHGIDEYEPDLAKIYPLGRSVIALFASDATIAAAIIGKLAVEFRAEWGQSWNLPLTVAEVASRYCTAYSELVGRRIDEALSGLGMTRAEFLTSEKKLRPSVEREAWKRIDEIENPNPDSTAIIAGVDREGGPDLYLVENRTATPMRSPGFVCLGSGDNHARTELIARGYDIARLQGEVMLMALAAKRRAELAVGVGEKTHMCVCGPESDGLRFLTNVDEGPLGKLHEDQRDDCNELFRTRLKLAQQTYGGDLPLMLPIERPPNPSAPQSRPESKDGS